MPESSETKQEPWIAFELVESPEDNQVKERPNNAVLTSDKNAIARDSNKKHTDSPETPFSKGITAIKNIFKPNFFKKEENPSRSNYDHKDKYRDTKHDDLAYYESVPNTFNKKYLFNTPAKIASSSHNEAAYKQEEMDAREFGSMSFNTYEWEFAPYMLKLKKQIQQHIFPPPAFTHLGFGGTNLFRFRIHTNGQLEGPVMLQYQGEKALVETSENAISLSSPFWPLPEDFPEDYLEVTASFNYIIYSNKER